MDHLQKYILQVRNHLLLLFVIENIVVGGIWIAGEMYGLDTLWICVGAASVGLIIGSVLATLGSRHVTRPMQLVRQGILHVAPNTASSEPAPELGNIGMGQELVTNLITTMYQVANVVEGIEKVAIKKQADLTKNFIANSLPIPLLVLNTEQSVLFANDAAVKYFRLSGAGDIVGQNIYTALDLSFLNAFTFDAWLTNAKKNKLTATQTWERVKLGLKDDAKTTLLFDLAAYYNKDNPNNYETILVFFDHTSQYSQDDQALSLVALAVHEIRTPLTLLRGYIEVFEEELHGVASPELADYLRKMNASAAQLTAFINNILNVARVEEDQLTLQLHEEQWDQVLTKTVQDLSMRAGVHGITLKLSIENSLPTVGVDKTSIYEVIANLIDNAIKYSGSAKEIIVRSYLTQDGLVETTVQDFGVGIPSSGMPNLFDKFYRNHRNRATIGGTGLGLFLSKAIVGAHGGHIWVRSKEGEGSIFGFTVLPYSKLASEAKTGDNNGIIRGAHGWIKNHSLYRR